MPLRTHIYSYIHTDTHSIHICVFATSVKENKHIVNLKEDKVEAYMGGEKDEGRKRMREMMQLYYKSQKYFKTIFKKNRARSNIWIAPWLTCPLQGVRWEFEPEEVENQGHP